MLLVSWWLKYVGDVGEFGGVRYVDAVAVCG